VSEFNDPDPYAMRRIILAPCSPFSVEADVMRHTAELGRKFGVPIHTHLCETVDEEEYCLATYGKRPLDVMADWGWIGDNVFYAHGIWFNDAELDVLAETGTGVAHCPGSNMRLGSGISRIREMLDRGVRIGIAVDGSASNDTSDMLGEVRNAMLLQRVKYGPDAMSAREALRVATKGGASLLGYETLGSIQPGAAADLALFDVHTLQYAGSLSDPLAALLFCGYRHDTDFTIVNGRVVVDHGKLVGLDETELTEMANQMSANLLQKAGITG